MGGWDSHIDHDFYVRAYSDRLESKRFLVSCYQASDKDTRIFKIQGTRYNVAITRSPTCTYSHTLSVSTHTIYYQENTPTPEIVCTALTDDNFILVLDDIDSPTLF
mgnify:CR=1 FL=1